jgi:hypothetical protein
MASKNTDPESHPYIPKYEAYTESVQLMAYWEPRAGDTYTKVPKQVWIEIVRLLHKTANRDSDYSYRERAEEIMEKLKEVLW